MRESEGGGGTGEREGERAGRTHTRTETHLRKVLTYADRYRKLKSPNPHSTRECVDN